MGLVRPAIIMTVIHDKERITKMSPCVVICHLMFMVIFETEANFLSFQRNTLRIQIQKENKDVTLGSQQDMTMLLAGELYFGSGVSVFLGTTNN